MTLDEFMLDAAPDKVYCVGSKSGWVFCGTREEYAQHIDEANSLLLRNLKRTVRNTKKNLDVRCDSTPPPMRREPYRSSSGTMKDPETYEDYIKRLERYAKSTAWMLKHLADVKQKLADYTALRTREGLDDYDMPVSGGKAVIIKGSDNGSFWDVDEFREWIKTGKLPTVKEGDDLSESSL